MMQVLKDIGGVELPETLARFSQEPQPSTNGGAPAVSPSAVAGLPAKPVADGGPATPAGQ
jgi:hypothetical protein